MIENPILTHYRHLANRDGFLELSDDFEINELYSRSGVIGAKSCFTPEGIYFKKFDCRDEFMHRRYEAEILLSQVYSKFGLNSSIYVPVEHKDCRFLLCDSMLTKNTKDVNDFHRSLEDGLPSYFGDVLFCGDNPALKYFTPEALSQKLNMRAIDVACKYTDRAFHNFFYNLDEEKRVCGLSVFDYEKSGDAFDRDLWGRNLAFPKETSYGFSLGKDVLQEMKENEEVLNYFNPSEVAEKLGKLNVPAIAKDIEETINYRISPEFVEALDASINETAEELIK